MSGVPHGPWAVLVIWKDGTQQHMEDHHGRVARFSSKRKAQEKVEFLRDGMGDEVQSINVVPWRGAV